MAKEWIEALTQSIREKNREAAEEFGRQEHWAEVVSTKGKVFFGDMVRALEENFAQIRRQLQGDPTAAEIAAVPTGATQMRLTRARFPWFDAHITHEGNDMTLEYAKDGDAPADPASVGQKKLVFAFHVAADDVLSVEDAEGEQRYGTPEEVARRITEILFEV